MESSVDMKRVRENDAFGARIRKDLAVDNHMNTDNNDRKVLADAIQRFIAAFDEKCAFHLGSSRKIAAAPVCLSSNRCEKPSASLPIVTALNVHEANSVV